MVLQPWPGSILSAGAGLSCFAGGSVLDSVMHKEKKAMLNMKMTTSIWRGLAILVVMFLFSVPGLARSQVGKESLKVFSSSANATDPCTCF